MGASFDFNKIKRSFFNVTLKDDAHITVKMPVKKTFERLLATGEWEDKSPAEQLKELDEICAEILTNNLEKRRVSAAYMAEYDIYEKSQMLAAYSDFVTGVKNDPN